LNGPADAAPGCYARLLRLAGCAALTTV